MKSEMSCLAGRQEDVDALDVDQQAALDLALHDALDLVALVVLARDALPGAQPVGAALREQRRVRVVEAVVVDLVRVARLGQRLAELRERDLALGLAADVHHHHAGALVDRVDPRLHDAAVLDVLDRRGQLVGELGLAHAAQGGLDLLFECGGVEFELLETLGGDRHEGRKAVGSRVRRVRGRGRGVPARTKRPRRARARAEDSRGPETGNAMGRPDPGSSP